MYKIPKVQFEKLKSSCPKKEGTVYMLVHMRNWSGTRIILQGVVAEN